ncbi:MAG TPA: sulfatase [Actinomycetota bacterium]
MPLIRRAAALAAGLALVASSPGPGPAATAAAQDSPPNILIILSDDQRAGTLGVMPKTRRWFKRAGVLYPRAYATTPVCCPSRASILTGRYAHNHDVNTNQEAQELDHDTSIQRYLQDAGYRTGFLGKYMNAWPLLEPPPHFDRWALMAPARHRDATFNIDGTVRTVRRYSTDFIAERAARMIEELEATGDPWFILVAPYAPHGPFQPSKKYRRAKVPRFRPTPSMLEKDRRDKPPYVQVRRQPLRNAKRIRRLQLRMLMSVDDLVGETMRALGRTGARQRTLAFYLSDHGYLWTDHGLKGKNHPYTESIRLPLLARWPGRLPPGTEDLRIATNVDVPATILDAAGVAAPDPPLDGRSLLAPGVRDRLFTEAWPENHVPHWRSLRTDAFHYVEYRDQETGDTTFREYYDLANDPWQLRNLLGDSNLANDPPPWMLTALSLQLERDAVCEGTSGPSACP